MSTKIVQKTSERLEIEKLIEKQPTTMSKYQIDNFVINEKMTDFKILKQILLELGTRYRAYDDLKIDIEIEELEIEGLEEQAKSLHGREQKILNLQIKKRKNNLAAFYKTKSNHEYEISIMEENYKVLKERADETPDEILNDDTGEEIYWVNKFIKEAQVDIMTNGRIGKGVLDAIFMLPGHLQEVIINNSIQQAANSNGFISHNENSIIESIKGEQKVSLMLNTIIGEKTDISEE